jgi:hypothetical protein
MNRSDTPDPMHFVSQLDAEMEAVQMECPHCKIKTEVLDAGSRHAVGVTHERGCPDFVDLD